MRIYNGTKLQLDLPLAGSQRISISPNSVSGDIMPSTDFLSLLVSSYDYSEIALIVSGPFEINMCSSVSGAVGFVVQSLEEAAERFSKKKKVDNNPVEETKEEVCKKCNNSPCSCNDSSNKTENDYCCENKEDTEVKEDKGKDIVEEKENKEDNNSKDAVEKLAKDSILEKKSVAKKSVIDSK